MSGAVAEDVESRTIAEVKASTKFLLDSLKTKMDSLSECGPDIGKLMKAGVDYPGAALTARKFFGTDSVGYVAIDGTQSIDQQLDLVVFYIGAFAYSGQARFTGANVEIGPPKANEQSLSASAAIPLSEEDAASVFGQRRESGIEVDPERLPSSLMHLAEYFLAYRSAIEEGGPKIILLDRTLAGDVAHLVWSTRDFVWGKFSVLLGLETPAGSVAPFDLELARMLMTNRELSTPAPRSQLLKLAVIQELFAGGALTVEELLRRTGADPKWAERLLRDLATLDDHFSIFESTEPYKLRPEVCKYWDRVVYAASSVASHIFDPEGSHPLRVKKGQSDAWVTADDLDLLVLIFIRALTMRAWSDRVLPIGFIKDTNAFELVNSALPLMRSAGLLSVSHEFPNFNSDKMLLQTNSVVNASQTPTPWHTPEIDAAFRTMAPDPDPTLGEGEARVNGAYENVIYQERVFVKTYLQLWSSKRNPSIRSHVFTFDRPVYPGYDHWDELLLHNRDGPTDADVRPVLHYKRGSELTNMAMALLDSMGHEVIPEALGHNYPLFLADKKAKSILKQTSEAYRSAVELELAKSDLDQQVLFSRRFRDYRSQVEGQRRGG